VKNTIRAGFSERLRQALDEAGYKHRSKRSAGALFGITAQALGKWLTGQGMPSSTRAAHVANVLGVRKAWLLDAELPMRTASMTMEIRTQNGEPVSISMDECLLLDNYRSLPQRQQEAVGRLLASMRQNQPVPAEESSVTARVES
jgi:transcriptional regulator with XRE-family HTH domain